MHSRDGNHWPVALRDALEASKNGQIGTLYPVYIHGQADT
jgi:hypothetical protein